MTTELNTYGENIRHIQNERATAELTLAHLRDELHNTEIRQKIVEKEAEIRELTDRETEVKNNILAGMVANNLKTVEFTNQRFTAKQNPASVHIIDENLIPQNFKKLKTDVVIDKKSIKEAIQKGEDVQGAELTYGYSLVISPR